MKKHLKLLFHWTKMLSGKSYYHVPQKLGKAFEADNLKGYFNDMTGKTNWHGLSDAEGIPVSQLIDSSTVYFPTTIVQKALGHHDQYILTRDYKELARFFDVCNWLVRNQDERGGWEVEKIMSLTGGLRYSAMPQGEAISALVRAWKYTNNGQYLKAAQRAYSLMITSTEDGGTCCYEGNSIYLEEYPANKKNTVLNGWVFALFGIYDLFLAAGDDTCRKVFDQSFSTLKNHLHVFDAGFWSYYDERKALASPFYHDLHISQLEALMLVTDDKIIRHYIEKWKGYRSSLSRRYGAFILKAYQKLKNPAPVVIVK